MFSKLNVSDFADIITHQLCCIESACVSAAKDIGPAREVRHIGHTRQPQQQARSPGKNRVLETDGEVWSGCVDGECVVLGGEKVAVV